MRSETQASASILRVCKSRAECHAPRLLAVMGAIELDLSTTGVSSAGWRTCGPAELTLVDRCGSSHAIEVGLSYSSEGPLLDLTCAEPDAGPGDAVQD